MPVDRVIILVFDSLGVGELPDASAYGDAGSNTLANIAGTVAGLTLPTLQKLGIGNIIDIEGIQAADRPLASFGKMVEISHGKDTTVGLWEMMGLVTKTAFPVFPKGFPRTVIDRFEKECGCRILGNVAASGTEIIDELGEEHMRTRCPIVYTSADSVFQIAAHEEVIPVKRLYELCLIARHILTGELGVDRVIARPFIGEPGNFIRTEHRKDFGLPPKGKMALDYAAEAGLNVFAVGKVWDVFSGRGITKAVKTKNNEEGFARTTELIKQGAPGVILTILGDFDTIWGHRNDVKGYAKGLVEADKRLGELIRFMQIDDILFIVADHGCDPTRPGTDHTREYVPLLIFGDIVKPGIFLGTRTSMCDLGKTIADVLDFDADIQGISFAKDIIKEE